MTKLEKPMKTNMTNNAMKRPTIGTTVRTVQGVRMVGMVVRPFFGPFTDGQYRQPYSHERREATYVQWHDGTIGWIHARFVEVVKLGTQ